MKNQYIVLLFLIAFTKAQNPTEIPNQNVTEISYPIPTKNPNIRDAIEGEFPHQVSLHWSNGVTYKYLCAGTLLSSNWVITLSMCIKTLPDIGFILVKSGLLRINGYGQRFSQSGSNVYYVEGSITLIKLESPLRLDSKLVAPANLPELGVIYKNFATTIGWSEESDHQGPLKAVDVDLISGFNCNYLYKLSLSDYWNYCTVQNNTTPSCISDAGAPLLINDKGKVIIIGIAAMSKLPCEKNKGFTIYESVSKDILWIKDTIMNNK